MTKTRKKLLAILLPETVEAYAELVESAGMTDYSLAWVFAVVILPPLVEETVFRGLIFHYLKKGGAGLIFVLAVYGRPCRERHRRRQ